MSPGELQKRNSGDVSCVERPRPPRGRPWWFPQHLLWQGGGHCCLCVAETWGAGGELTVEQRMPGALSLWKQGLPREGGQCLSFPVGSKLGVGTKVGAAGRY